MDEAGLSRSQDEELVQQVQFFAGLEPNGLAGGYADLGTGAWISSNACLAGLDVEDAKSAEFDAVIACERLLHGFENCVDGGLCLDAWQSGTLHYALNEVLLDQWVAFLLPTKARYRGSRFDLRP
jgi:hypothetical protein